MEDTNAKLHVECRPSAGPNGENAEYICEVDGTANGLLNAYVMLSKELIEQLTDALGVSLATNLFAQALETVLAETSEYWGEEE